MPRGWFFESERTTDGAIKLAMAGTQDIVGADFLHCLVTDSISLERAESLITKR